MAIGMETSASQDLRIACPFEEFMHLCSDSKH